MNYIFKIIIIFLILIYLNKKESFSNITDKFTPEQIAQLIQQQKNQEKQSSSLRSSVDDLVNIGEMHKNGSITVKNLTIKGDLSSPKTIVKKNYNVDDLINTKELLIKNKNNTHTNFNHNDGNENYIRGDSWADHGKLTCNNINVGNKLDTRRIDIRNDGGKNHTHFNINHSGVSHIRGDVHQDTGNIHTDNSNFKNITGIELHTRKIRSRHHCVYWDHGCVSRSLDAAGNNWGKITPMKWNHGPHHNKGGFVVPDRHTNHHRYVAGTEGHHHYHTHMSEADGSSHRRW